MVSSIVNEPINHEKLWKYTVWKKKYLKEIQKSSSKAMDEQREVFQFLQQLNYESQIT